MQAKICEAFAHTTQKIDGSTELSIWQEVADSDEERTTTLEQHMYAMLVHMAGVDHQYSGSYPKSSTPKHPHYQDYMDNYFLDDNET